MNLSGKRLVKASQQARATIHVCSECGGTLTVAEFIEKHCVACGKDVDIIATKGRAA